MRVAKESVEHSEQEGLVLHARSPESVWLLADSTPALPTVLERAGVPATSSKTFKKGSAPLDI